MPGAHCIEGWMDCRVGVDVVVHRKKICPCRQSNSRLPGLPLHSLVTTLTELCRLQHGQCTCKRNIQARSYDHWCSGKAGYYIIWVSVCSLRYPAYTGHAPYCLVWPVWLYHIFLHYLINGTICWKKKVIEYKICVLIFSITFIAEISHLKNSAIYCHTCHTSSCKVSFVLVRL